MASGYFSYFGSTAHGDTNGWYSTDLGDTWHVVVLNSNCGNVDCAAGSAQDQWLRADLAASTRPCTIAIWHHPRFTSGTRVQVDDTVLPFWNALIADGAELVLNGHDHDYERFHRQTATGTLDSMAIREFVVGTGAVLDSGTGVCRP